MKKQTPNRAHLFRQKRNAQRIELAVTLTLPSGLEVKVNRPSLETWMMSGRIPQSLTQKVLEMFGSGEKPRASEVLKRMQQEGGKALADSLVFVREFVRATLVSPRLIIPNLDGREADPEKDEIDATDIDPTDFAFLFHWATSGAPGVPVKTEGGEVSAEALENFRPVGGGDSPRAEQ